MSDLLMLGKKNGRIPYGEKKYLFMRKKEGNQKKQANTYSVNEKTFHIVRKEGFL